MLIPRGDTSLDGTWPRAKKSDEKDSERRLLSRAGARRASRPACAPRPRQSTAVIVDVDREALQAVAGRAYPLGCIADRRPPFPSNARILLLIVLRCTTSAL